MKILIIIAFLITYSICEVFYLKKHGRIQIEDSSGIIYLNANSFEYNDYIHIVFKANNGQMNNIIYYQFDNDIPTSTFSPKLSLDTTFSDSSSDDDNNNYVKNYYYEIKKSIEKNYLIIKYLDFQTSRSYGYLEIENTKFNSSYYIIIIIAVIAVIIIIALVVYFLKVKLEKQEYQIMELEKSLTLQKEKMSNNSAPTPYDNYQ